MPHNGFTDHSDDDHPATGNGSMSHLDLGDDQRRIPLPPVRGRFRQPTAADCRDLGNLSHQTPLAVLQPAHADDIAATVSWAREHDLPVMPRGAHHTTGGQSLTTGIAVDMRALDGITIDSDIANVDAGVRFDILVEAAWKTGRKPANGVPGYLGLTIGGVLSAGGISPAPRRGAIADSVLDLDIVTPDGASLTCSAERHPDVFHSVLAGFGRHGIITRARLALAAAPRRARTLVWRYSFSDTRRALDDLTRLAADPTIQELIVKWAPDDSGRFAADLYADQHYDDQPPPPPEIMRTADATSDMCWLDRTTAITAEYHEMETHGWSQATKPWFDMFLPQDTAAEVIDDITGELTRRDAPSDGAVVLVMLKRRGAFGPAMDRHLPTSGEWVYLFDVLSDNWRHDLDGTWQADMLARNKRWTRRALDAGGTPYPIGTPVES